MLKSARRASMHALFGVACAAGLIATTPAAFGQTRPHSLSIVAQGDGPTGVKLTTVVDYADLDLATDAGRTAFRERVRTAAGALCRRLGEPAAGGGALLLSCQQAAFFDAVVVERRLIAEAAGGGETQSSVAAGR
jgi:UrcA family protein